MSQFTIVFADLTGSTSIFEKLGNIKATQQITQLTQWIGIVCAGHKGNVVKYLGDGVLILFTESHDAISAAIEMQSIHHKRIKNYSDNLNMRLQVGMARGDVVVQDGDCYGDAVNLASRLSDISGSEQILASESVMHQLPANFGVRARCMGSMLIRGRTESCVVHKIEWQEEIASDAYTVPAKLMSFPSVKMKAEACYIELSCTNTKIRFNAAQLPIFLGRDFTANFVINDPRVSRKHAFIDWRAGKFYLQDISSYGTWVRYEVNNLTFSIRRQECILLMNGSLALGASFENFTVPTVSFKFN